MENVQTENDEISLLDLFAVILKYKRVVIIFTITAMIISVALSVISLKLPAEKSFLPNVYTPYSSMLINDSSSGSGGGISSAIAASGLSGLASLAGVNVPTSSSNSSLALYLISSNLLLDSITDNFGIVERYKIKNYVRYNSRKALKQSLVGKFDDETGIFTLSFSDIEPAFAQAVVNYSVDWLERKFDELGLDSNKIQKANYEKNLQASFDEIVRLEEESRKLGASVAGGNAAWNIPSVSVSASKIQMELSAQKEVYTQIKTQLELLKIKMQSEQPVFQIIERPEIPDRKSKPSRGRFCIISVFAAFFISIFVVFLLNMFENLKKDKESWEKLFPKKTKD